jgi:hypothetical protein
LTQGTVTFASATVLLVATLSPNLGVRLDTEPTKSSWDRAMAILEFHKRNIASVARGIEILRRYRESIALRLSARSGMSHAIRSGPNPRFGFTDSKIGMSSSTSPIPNITMFPIFQELGEQGQQQQYGPSPSRAMPTPPRGGTWLMEGLYDFFTSDSLDEAWLVNQDFGQGDWMLHNF